MLKNWAMSPAVLLRVAVVLQLMLIAASVALVSSFEAGLPAHLQEWLAGDEQGELGVVALAVMPLFPGLLLAMLISSIGLLCLQKWAAWLFLVANLGGPCLYLCLGPTVEHAVITMMGDIEMLLCGFIIGVSFLTDALGPKQISPPPSAP